MKIFFLKHAAIIISSGGLLYNSWFIGDHVRERCDTALHNLHRVRTSLTNTKPKGMRQLAAQRRKLGVEFGQAFMGRKRKQHLSYSAEKKNKVSYTHRFFCLNECNQKVVPKNDKEKDSLLEAGLGEKRITIPDIDISGEEFRKLLLEEFPKLREGGGFMFAKCKSNSKVLEPLSPLCLTSPRVLRDRVGSVRTYIFPLQRNLDLLSSNECSSAVSSTDV